MTAISGKKANQIDVNYERLLESLIRIKDDAEKQQQRFQKYLQKAELLRWRIIATSMLLSLGISVLLALVTTQAIAHPIKEVSQVALRVTEEAN